MPVPCYLDGKYMTEVEVGMEMPSVVTVDRVEYTLCKFSGVYTNRPFASKQDYMESIDDDVPF